MTGSTTHKGAWTITLLLFLFMMINFADKAIVGLAGVPIMLSNKIDELVKNLTELKVREPISTNAASIPGRTLSTVPR